LHGVNLSQYEEFAVPTPPPHPQELLFEFLVLRNICGDRQEGADPARRIAQAERGRAIFGQSCISCHMGGNGTDNNTGRLHAPDETGMSAAYAMRTANKMYRTTPLRGLAQHAPYFHDGSAATLTEVVNHYNQFKKLGLTSQQRSDLAEYLKSL